MAVDTLDRIALRIERETLGPESNTLVKLYMVANDARGSYHHACAMVNGEIVAYGSGRMYIDARLAMCHLGDDARDKRHA